MPTNGVSTVTFKVVLNSSGFTSGQTIPNAAYTGYDFIYDPLLPSVTGSMDSNIAIVTLTVPKATIKKNVDLKFATAGDTLQYTLVINNLSSPSTATNIILVDTIPTGVTFVPGSVLINNSPSTGNPSPPTGLTIPDVLPNTATTIVFSVKVNTLPNVNFATNSGVLSLTQDGSTFSTLSNSVTTTLNYLVLTSSKTVNKTSGNIGDILTYTIPISNLGNGTATNVIFLDTIPSGTTLISNSFKQDGTVISGSPSFPGITLPNSIGVNKTTTVTFQVQITAAPNPNPIPNTASAFSTYTIDSTTTPNITGTSSTNTNTVNTSVNFASLSGITKFVDKSFANCGDTITYTIVIPNSGTVTAQNIVFKDTIPNGTSFVSNSVFINGSQQTNAFPGSGVTIPNIAPGATATLTFSVIVQC